MSCILMSKLTRTQALDSQGEENDNSLKRKRRNSEGGDHYCKVAKQEENMTDTSNQRRANFSALTPASNGLNRTSPSLVNLKPGTAKKLVIKNFKGTAICIFFSLDQC